MSFYIYYIIVYLILLFLSILVFKPTDKIFRPVHDKLAKKLINHKCNNVARRIVSASWWIFAIYTITKIISFGNTDRLLLSILFILFFLLINRIQLAIYAILIFPAELYIILVKQRQKDKGLTEKIAAYTRIRFSTIFIYSAILLSFSFRFIVTKSNYEIIGFIIILSAGLYLMTSLYNIFKYQKSLLYASDKIETFQPTIKDHNFLNSTFVLLTSIVSFYTKYISRNKKDEPPIIKIKKWANEKLTKSKYLTKVGFSIFKIYLTLKLVFIILTTVLFLIIVNANFFAQLQYIGIISTSIKSLPQFLLFSFYVSFGQSPENLSFLISANYLSIYFLIIGIFGWGVTIIYILLFIDILATSLGDLYESSINVAKTLVDEFLKFLNSLPPENNK